MKGIIIIIALVIALPALALLNLLYQKEIVDFFTALGWGKLAGLLSGPWWNSLPNWVVAWVATLALAFTARQMIQGQRSTNAQIAVDLFRELRSDKTLEQLSYIYSLKQDSFKCLPEDMKKYIDYLLGKFELVAALVALKVIESKLATGPYGGPAALRLWYVLHDYIKEAREHRGYFCENYEGFTRLCLNYFHQAGQKVKLHRAGEDDTELVFIELQKPELRPRTFAEIKGDKKKDKRQI